jgi:hypothetical protein
MDSKLDHESSAARWLIEFVRSDPGKWTDAVTAVFQKKWVTLLGTQYWKSTSLPSSARMKDWHQELGKIVKTLEAGKPWSGDCSLWRQVQINEGQLVPRRITSPSDSDTNKFLTKVMDVFEESSTDMRICQRQDCEKLFVRTKRQAYCSAKCRGTELKRRHRKKQSK